jgi:hypothetical protein
MTIQSSFGIASLVLGGVVAGTLGVAGCAGTSDYVYQPDTANATAGGLPATRTPIPQEAPQGAIEVVSYGVTKLQREGTSIPALHVRAIVTNDGDDTAWTMDASQQLVEIPGEGRSRPIFVNADITTLPQVTIARHDRRVLDLYYALPDTISNESRLPRFDLLWTVNTASRVVASRTSFDRVDRAPDVAYETTAWPLWAGWGPYWWYDPFWVGPGVVFVHAHPYHFHGAGRVTVGRFDGHFRAGGAHVSVRGHR